MLTPEAKVTRPAPLRAYWLAQDAAVDADRFREALVGTLSLLVDEHTWHRALRLAAEAELERAGKR